MAPVSTRTSSAPARREQLSTRIVFFIAGFGMAAWAPLVPFAKARVGVDEGVLGLLLLCLGIGSIVTMPLAGALAARLGCRFVITVSALLLCLTLPLLASVSRLPLLVAALLVFGAGVGAIDLSMNIQAIIVERVSGRSMMSGFHGLFSFGGIAGAAGIAALLGAGASPLIATLVVTAGIVVALAIAAPHLLPYGSKSEGAPFALPRGIVLFIGVLCFIMFMTEGAALDWSAVFLTSARGMETSFAGLGYAAFALTMTIGRLLGDRIVQRFGGTNIIIFGGLCAAAGFARDAGSCLASGVARLCTGWRGLLKYRACSVHQRRPPNNHAGECGCSSDHDSRLRRHPRRPSGNRVRGACGEPVGGISDRGIPA
jgi:predicted MFS family arabinose efflux permease